MNRTDRLLAIVLELQAKKSVRAEDLAYHFSITKRTVYRDIQSLCEAGVPVLAVPGKGYGLVEGYFLPPVAFTREEATMLILGGDFAAQNFDAQFRTAARQAISKIEAVLSSETRRDVAYLRESVRFVAFPAHGNDTLEESLRLIRRAIIDRRVVSFAYHRPFGEDRKTKRRADPYALVHIGGNWIMSGHCHLRNDLRSFRLGRMDAVEVLDRTFERPRRFRLSQLAQDRGPTVTARVHVGNETARWVLESSRYHVAGHRKSGSGVVMTVRANSLDQVAAIIMAWGSDARVLGPQAVREKVRGLALSLAEKNL